MQKCGVSDSRKSHGKSAAEKALSAPLGKGRQLKLSFRASFGSHLPQCLSVGTARSCSAQKTKGGAGLAGVQALVGRTS